MNLQERIRLLARLGQYIINNSADWQEVVTRAGIENSWFIPGFTQSATLQIAHNYLDEGKLQEWATVNAVKEQASPKTIGIIMAGNIPAVGMHDLLAVFMSGHKAMVKLSSKDRVIIQHFIDLLVSWQPEVSRFITTSEMLKGCDAYIATGSNNTSRYFEYYFEKYPHIIRRNRTSVALLTGAETTEELYKLADDVFLYFGLGCRNVTKLYVPENYNFEPLLNCFKNYNWLIEHNKYKNNYDYNLAIHLLNGNFYMSTEALLLVEQEALFSPISQVNYQYYNNAEQLAVELKHLPDLQAITGHSYISFGQAQLPSLNVFADGVNTLEFLNNL